MIVKVLGSSSKGNCYIVETATDKLIVDAGIPYKEIQKGLNFNFKGVVGTLVTHEHRRPFKGH
jgi:phosphoribosyl 1,2-cyclic phosphodiesterase